MGGRIMAQQSAEQIIQLDFAEAFADAVLVYEIWSPEYPGREIRIGPRNYSIIEVCGFVDQFTDRLPERVFLKLRSYIHDHPDGLLWPDLAADPSYATAARCLRKMIERRTEDRKLREAWRRNLEWCPAACRRPGRSTKASPASSCGSDSPAAVFKSLPA